MTTVRPNKCDENSLYVEAFTWLRKEKVTILNEIAGGLNHCITESKNMNH